MLEAGETVTLVRRVVDNGGNLVDPASIGLTITDPAGSVTNVAQGALTHASLGVWTYVLTVTAVGTWTYRFDATGVPDGGETAYLEVHPKADGGARSGPCANWCSVDDLINTGKLPTLPADAEGIEERMIAAASDLLWRWTGFRWGGICADTVRPCAQSTYLQGDYAWDRPMGWGSTLWNWIPAWGLCACQANVHRQCGCRLLSEIDLGRFPVTRITQVLQDGGVLAPSAYRIDDFRFLVRLDGSRWPCCQDLTADPASATNTLQVAFDWGKPPPESGREAAVRLALEFCQAYSSNPCQVPENVQTLLRQGVQTVKIPPTSYGRDINGNIKTGIHEVDFFLSAVPTGRPGLIASPDRDAKVRRTGTVA